MAAAENLLFPHFPFAFGSSGLSEKLAVMVPLAVVALVAGTSEEGDPCTTVAAEGRIGPVEPAQVDTFEGLFAAGRIRLFISPVFELDSWLITSF